MKKIGIVIGSLAFFLEGSLIAAKTQSLFFYYPGQSLSWPGPNTWRLEDKAFILEADTVFFDNAIIETFPKGATALKNGRSGGIISIKARKAYGKLTIYSRGEDGGQGKLGFNGKALTVPSDALPKINKVSFPCPELVAVAGGGALSDYYCQSEPLMNTKPMQGKKGSNGGKGGDTAMIDISVLENSDLKVHVVSEPGRGGKPGIGGRAGQMESDDFFTPCQLAKYPVTMRNGSPGLKGKEGKKKPVCIRMGRLVSPGCQSP